MTERKSYQEEAERLAKAIDIAIDAFKTHLPKEWEEKHLHHTVSCYREWKENALYPHPQFKKIASLKYQIEDVLTYFQEASGATVEYFWKHIQDAGLDYVRENKLKKILMRGKIRGRIEYEYIMDMVLVAEQIGFTTPAESQKLNELIHQFESKNKKIIKKIKYGIMLPCGNSFLCE